MSIDALEKYLTKYQRQNHGTDNNTNRSNDRCYDGKLKDTFQGHRASVIAI